MRFKRVIQVLALMLTLGSVSLCRMDSANAAEKVLADQRLPPGVLLYLSVPNAPAAHESFRETGISELIHDRSLEEFRQQLVEKYNEWQAEAQEELGLPPSDIAALFAGEITVAVVRPVGQSLGGVMFLDIGNHQDILDQLIAKAEESDKEGMAEKETETIEGAEVTIYTVTDKDDADADPITVAYFVKDNTLVVASALSILESVLDQWDGDAEESETFAGNEIYQEIMAKCSTDEETIPAFKYFIDPVGLIASGLGMNPDTQLFAGMVYAPTFGLTALKGVGGTVELATEDYDSISRSMYYVDGEPSGILKIFEFRPTISAPPEWVPADAGQYMALDWNLKGAYEAIESIYDSFTGPGKFSAMVNGLAQQGGANLHPKDDVIDVLSGKIEWYLVPSENPADLVGTFALGVNDTQKGQKLLDSIMGLSGGSKTSQFKGVQLYQADGDGKSGAAAIKDNMIMIAKDVDQLKLTLSGPSKTPLVKSEEYQNLAKTIPEKVSLLGYQDPADQLAAGYEKARAGDFDSFTEGKLNFSVLPPFEVLRKYLSPSASYFVPDEHGTLGVQFSLKRKE